MDVTSTGESVVDQQREKSGVKRKVHSLEGVVQTQGKEQSQQQKRKWGLKIKKQASKDEDCAKEIRERESQIQFYQSKLGDAEKLEEQNLQLATDLSGKESKLDEVNKQLLALKQQMKGMIDQNADLKKQVVDTEYKYQDEVKQLKDKLSKLQEQLHSESHVEVIIVDKDKCSGQTPATEKGQIAQLQSRVESLTAELDKTIKHSTSQSRKILHLKQHIHGTKV